MSSRPRIASIDYVRGAVMILMALDHVRYYFTNHPAAPESMVHTNLAIFFTRWVTHYCAPAFFFLAGTSAKRSNAKPSFLALRGLLLVALELTIIGFGWSFNPGYSLGGVIWALGWCMVVLALFVRLPVIVPAIAGLAILFGHDLLQHVTTPPVLRGIGMMGSWFVLYPLIPWLGVMLAGYALGALYDLPAERRKRILLTMGSAAIALFIVLRLTNVYGNPEEPSTRGGVGHFAPQATPALTLIAFLNTEKYPASLQFLLMTLGPALIALALLEREPRTFLARAVTVFGRVPLFYYVLHIYLIHIVAYVIALLTGQPSEWLGWGSYFPRGHPDGYGFGLGVVYAVWLGVLIALYPLCAWFMRYKARHSQRWLRYV